MEQTWDLISDIILYAALAVLAFFVCLAIVQLFRRKSLKKVDKPLKSLLIPLILVAITYIIFEYFLVLNTRPNGSGEPSFPSTHTLVAATTFFCTIFLLPSYISKKPLRVVFDIAMLILLAFLCVGRVLANMHWISDVAGALIFAAIFAFIYKIIIRSKKHV